MRKIAILSLFVFLSLSFAENNTNDTLIVDARVIDIPGTMPPNDLYDYVYVMKYRVIKVIKGVYTNQEILVGHYNPLIPRRLIKDKMKSVVSGSLEKFEKGAKHNLRLIEIEKVWNDAVENEFFDSDLPVYFALVADKKM